MSIAGSRRTLPHLTVLSQGPLRPPRWMGGGPEMEGAGSTTNSARLSCSYPVSSRSLGQPHPCSRAGPFGESIRERRRCERRRGGGGPSRRTEWAAARGPYRDRFSGTPHRSWFQLVQLVARSLHPFTVHPSGPPGLFLTQGTTESEKGGPGRRKPLVISGSERTAPGGPFPPRGSSNSVEIARPPVRAVSKVGLQSVRPPPAPAS